MSEEGNNNAGGVVVAFAVGALLGAGLALLYAPRSGKETRDLIGEKGRELRDKAGEIRTDTRDFVEAKKAELAAAVEAGKQAIRDERGKHA
ncbi:MAG: YtxH domain-containing protein [Candidatus Krumholzibacteriia bacterium]